MRFDERCSQLQACAGCCLRLAAVREVAAYSSSDLPHSAAEVLSALGEGQQHSTDQNGPEAGDETSTHQSSAAAGDEGSKRRRLDGTGDNADLQKVAAVCPLCLGVLQTWHPASCGLQGEAAVAPSLSRQACCTFQLVTTVSSLNDLSHHAAPAAGAAAAGAEGAASPLAASQAEVSGNHGAPVAEQRRATVPSLAAAAAAIAEEFEFESFALEVSLPASLAVRQQALSWRLRQRQQQGQREDVAAALGAAMESTVGEPAAGCCGVY